MDNAVSKHVLEFKCKLVGDEILSVFDMVMILNFVEFECSWLIKFKNITISNTDNISSLTNLYLNSSTCLETALSIDLQ